MARILTETAGSAIWFIAGNTTLWALIPSCIWGHWSTPTCSAAKTNFIGIPLIFHGALPKPIFSLSPICITKPASRL